jgi:hypothetical protein
MIWITGDSYADWRSLIKSSCKYEQTLEGLLKQDYDVLCFARGGSGNIRQINLIEKYRTFNVLLPSIWIHAWTEVGRDQCSSVEIANRLIAMQKVLNCKLIVFGGQAPIPEDAQLILKESILTADWKKDILQVDYSASQYFSVIVEGGKHNLTTKELKKQTILAEKQLDILTKSNKFPDNAHPNSEEYYKLYQKIKEKINDRK